MPSITTPTLQACRQCGGGAPLDAHFCPQCSKILPLGRRGDYFTFLGVPRQLNLDAPDLEQRFRSLSRQFHPDYFYNSSPAERRASLERSSYLNDAYRTLRDPIRRLEYLLQVEGMAPGAGDGSPAGGRRDLSRSSPEREGLSRAVPPALLEEVFALNEELDEIRSMRASGAPAEQWRARLERARAPIEAKRADHERQLQALAARWDAAAAVSADERQDILRTLRERFLERNYISNLLAGIERELAQ